MTQLIAVLFSLFVFFHGIATAEEASKEKGIFGAWVFQEAILEHRDTQQTGSPFPESFIIESVGPDAGILTVKLPALSQPKVYSFSKLESTQHSSIQFYDNPEEIEEGKAFSLHEIALITYKDNILTVLFKWTDKRFNNTGDAKYFAIGSYTLAYHDGILTFTRDKHTEFPTHTALYKRVP